MLIDAHLIDRVQMQIALAEQRQTGKRIGSTLVDLKFIDENVLAAFLSKQIDVPCISLLHIDISKKVTRKMNRAIALECKAVPVRIDESGRLEVARADPTDHDTVAKIEKATAMTITALVAPESSVETMIEKMYPEILNGDSTLSVRQTALPRNMPNDPIFWDLIEELDNSDLDQRLGKIERSLDQIWVLLEKVLRTLEMRESVRTER